MEDQTSPAEQISQTPNEVTPVASNLTSKRKLPVVLAVVLGFVVLIGLAYGAYWYSQKNLALNPPTTESLTITPAKLVASSSAKLDDTAGWTTFEHKSGYSFRYPKTMKVGASGFGEIAPEISPHIHIALSSDSAYFDGPHASISEGVDTGVIKSAWTLEEKAQKIFSANTNNLGGPTTVVEPLHQAVFNGIYSYEFSIRGSGFQSVLDGYRGYTGVYKVVWLEHAGTSFMLSWTVTPELDQILSTFKFTDQTGGTAEIILY